jgi:hypothetical protein
MMNLALCTDYEAVHRLERFHLFPEMSNSGSPPAEVGGLPLIFTDTNLES